MPDHRDIYASDAEIYDLLVSREDRRGELAAVIARLCDCRRSDVVVELGAGTGRVTRLLAPQAGTVLAFDASEAMLEVARDRLAALGAANCDLAVADNAALPVPNGVADLLVAGWTIGHTVSWYPDTWRGRVEAVLGEMERVARPDSRLAVIETLGTGCETPLPPEKLKPFFAVLRDHGFTCEVIRTDYRSASPDEAVRLVRFFFGDELAAAVAASGSIEVPECTSAWTRSAGTG